MTVPVGFDYDDYLTLLLGGRGLDYVVVVLDGGEVDSVYGSVYVGVFGGVA